MDHRRLALLFLLLCTAGPAVASDLPEILGWRRDGATETYDKKSVWQAIDGAAELFTAYGFESLRTQDYHMGQARITVQLYVQTTPLGALGVYLREGGGATDPRPGSCLGLKGRHYLKVLVVQGTLGGKPCRALLGALKAALPGKDTPPPELALLPAGGQVSGSLGYTRQSYLGTRRLQNCLHARYTRKAGKPYTLFVVLPGPKRTIQDVWDGLAAGWKPARHGGLEVISTKIPYTGTVALVRRTDAVIGAAGVGELGATVAVLRWLTRSR